MHGNTAPERVHLVITCNSCTCVARGIRFSVFVGDVTEDWTPFGEIKFELDWEDGEEGGGYTSMYYQYTNADGETENSEEIDMATVLELCDQDVITDETVVFCDGMDDWVTFEEAKYQCEWPDGDEEEGEGDGSILYYETPDGENHEV